MFSSGTRAAWSAFRASLPATTSTRSPPPSPTQNLSLTFHLIILWKLTSCFHHLALGHGRHGASCEHHFQLLQVLGGRHPGLLPRQSGLLPHPVAAPPRHCHLRRKRKDIFVSWAISFLVFWFLLQRYTQGGEVGEEGGKSVRTGFGLVKLSKVRLG